MSELDERTEDYHAQVWSAAPAEYLEGRGLSHSTISRFRLGYVGEARDADQRRKGCLVLPYESGLGQVRQLRYRPLYPSEAKYLTGRGEHVHIFAVRAADNPTVCIAEGEMDAMSLWQAGYRAVGIPGANTWKPEWRWLFRDCERVILCFDPDAAGIRAAQQIYHGLSSVTDVDVARMPPKMDVNDVLRRYGEAGVKEVVG